MAGDREGTNLRTSLLCAPARSAAAASDPATDKGDYVEEFLTFQTTPDLRVPAFVLVPKKAQLPAPGVVVLHSHDGIYLWGKEKVVEDEREHPYSTAFKQRSYGSKSIASELARQGYVVMAIDMFYWGERRMLLDDDPSVYRERPLNMTEQEIRAFNQRASQDESLVARSLFTAGITWPGVVLWDDIRTLDYLAARPDVDRNRLGCVGLSVGGYRSFLLAALDERIKAAVDVGWMTSFGSQIKQHVIHTMGLSFHINGLYRYVDLPDIAGLIAPRAVLVINGSQDRLFALEGVKMAFDKIARCYAKAGAPDRSRCRLVRRATRVQPRHADGSLGVVPTMAVEQPSCLINSANERKRVSHASGAGRRGPRERACKGVRGTKSAG